MTLALHQNESDLKNNKSGAKTLNKPGIIYLLTEKKL